ncbi:protein LAZ1 homolog 2 isoform X3 [Cryptomeria japonica]|uniref:protein LAZ1 homolog 2 isoform X3 n=1 Tax=Cryptomeria japonica TaxID=3369 RepID=UPI0027D9D30D|nr:protein LAZ1 homolog 2 isoform X3 [Cryptomeria japonica]
MIKMESVFYLYKWALIVGGISVAVALTLSFLLILQHLRAYNNPAEQKWIVIVLFMVPVYASESVLSLWNPRISIECDILRNCYEAIALYAFGNYLIACLGGENRSIEFLERESNSDLSVALLKDNQNKKEFIQHPFPLSLMIRPWVRGQEFYRFTKFGIVQYMILKTVCAFLALVLELCGVYGDGEFKWHYGYPYITIVLNFSQGVAIAIICSPSVLGVSLPGGQKFQSGLQDFLICVEMAFAAVAHIFVFPVEPNRHSDENNHGSLTLESTSMTVETRKDTDKSFDKEGHDVVQVSQTEVEGHGTSLKESVQDIVLRGAEHVVHDVLITVSQAVEPMEKGVTKINETLHHLSHGGKLEDNEPKLEIDEQLSESTDNKSDEVTIKRHMVETSLGVNDPVQLDTKMLKRVLPDPVD